MNAHLEVADLVRMLAQGDREAVDLVLTEISRSGWRNAEVVIAATFGLAVNLRFPDGAVSPADVARFAAEAHSHYPAAGSASVADVESMIQAALGKPDRADHIAAELAARIQTAVLDKFLRDSGPTEAELETFLGQAEEAAAPYLT
ncbi:hypothetical protein ACIA3K_24075 [Micromonospora sp. NPDC051543]|uniref:hypothetical protein n=1 Tax=Micromonospora sp. NPDC051543 TaxID=3364287 RepID=UPI00378B4B9D